MSKETMGSLLRDWPPHMPLPDKYRDGAWWCRVVPGCGPACYGHRTLESAVRATVKNIRAMKKARTGKVVSR